MASSILAPVCDLDDIAACVSLTRPLLQGMYLTYARNSKFQNMRSQRHIDFMALCVVEVYSMDKSSAYQHAFVYIRQLAVDLRQASTPPCAFSQPRWEALSGGGCVAWAVCSQQTHKNDENL